LHGTICIENNGKLTSEALTENSIKVLKGSLKLVKGKSVIILPSTSVDFDTGRL